MERNKKFHILTQTPSFNWNQYWQPWALGVLQFLNKSSQLFQICPMPQAHTSLYYRTSLSLISGHKFILLWLLLFTLKFTSLKGKPINQLLGQIKKQQCQGQRKIPMIQGHIHLFIYLFTSIHSVAGPVLGLGHKYNDKYDLVSCLKVFKIWSGTNKMN